MVPAPLRRARVNERLTRAARFPVTLIVAPAGFGKSVALHDFVRDAGVEAIRYDVSREDATLLAFVRRLAETLQTIAPGAIASFPAVQERVMATQEPVRELSDWLAEHLKDASCTIAIDDLHYAAADPASIALLADLIERTGERISWILAARSDVGLPVASWIAYGRMDLPVGEDDLRFTIDEALAAAGNADSAIDTTEIEALRRLTEGWPVALAIALRTRTDASDLRTASAGAREMVYRYLAEQVFNGLPEAQRAFLRDSSVFSTFDVELAQRLGASPEFLADLRRDVTFVTEVAPGEYRYHDLFRDFLETELRRAGEREWTRALSSGARLLEERADARGALLLYAKAQDAPAILRLLESAGFALFERGHGAALAVAIDALSDEARLRSAAAIGLRAMLEAGHGRFELAERGFAAAIERAADPELRTALVHRYAIELVRHDRDCVALLEPYAKDETVPARLRALMLGTLATGYARLRRFDRAQQTIDLALDAAGEPDDETRARLYQQASYVYQFSPSHDRAKTFAERAIDLALSRDLYEVAARAYSVLYRIAYDADDARAAIAALDALLEYARKGGSNQARLFGLMARFEIEAERGETLALDRLSSEIEQSDPTFTPARAEALLPALALRAAWEHDFAVAYELLAGTAGHESAAERRALRFAETALYAFAAGLSEEGAAALEDANTALDECARPTLRSLMARLFAALCEMLRGRTSSAHRALSDVERTLPAGLPRIRALTHAIRARYRLQLGQGGDDAAAAALQRLRGADFGGYAALIEALPAPSGGETGYAALTPAEREILKLLATGASTKEVAAATGRSPYTVDTHIRSLCRKLNCSGRREAVALATGAGWVQT